MNQSCKFDDELIFSQIFYVNRITINQKYRNMGLGPLMIEYIKYRFADVTNAVVLQSSAFEVKDKNAISLYERHGFENYRENTWIYHEY